MKKLLLIFALLVITLSACGDTSEVNNNFHNEGDVNYYENFGNVQASDVEVNADVIEIQFDLDTVPYLWREEINDNNNNGVIEQCFNYKFPGFSIVVDSLAGYTGSKAKIVLDIYALYGVKEIHLYNEELNGLAFMGHDSELLLDDDIDDFLYKIKIFYNDELVNNFELNVSVKGMSSEIDWITYTYNDELSNIDMIKRIIPRNLIMEGKIFEKQLKIETVPSSVVNEVRDVNDDGKVEQYFDYETVDLKVDLSKDTYQELDITSELVIIAIDKNGDRVITSTNLLTDLSYEGGLQDIYFDEEVNTFVYIFNIYDSGELINHIEMEVDVDGMITEHDWSEFYE